MGKWGSGEVLPRLARRTGLGNIEASGSHRNLGKPAAYGGPHCARIFQYMV